MATATASIYRRGLLDPNDALFLRCLAGTAVFAVLLVIAVRLMPPPPRAVTHVEELPQRLARLILEPPKAMPARALPVAEKLRVAAKSAAAAAVTTESHPTHGAPLPAGGRRVETLHSLADGAGAAGRARAAADVGGSLASATSSMRSALAGLDASLGVTSSAEGGSVARGGRSRGIREARGAADLGAVGGTGGGAGTGAPAADLASSAVAGSLVSIGQLAAGSAWGTGGSADGAAAGSGGTAGFGDGSGGGHAGGVMGPGVYRSNASLLAVIQRYSAGIQFCYSNELKHDPALRGKLVVAITVAAGGQVTDASVVQNSTGSARLAACALSQIRDWHFPPIDSGVTAFHAPFVFTPPE